MVSVRLGLLGAVVGVAAAAQAAVSIVVGPVYNAANGSRYYKITGGDWNQLRAFAVSMGGDLASIDDADENAWVRANVVGNNTKPYIGLNDAGVEGTLVWSNGSTSTYRNWRLGEPSNSAAKDYVRYDASVAGTWEIVTVAFGPEAIVEISPIGGVPAPIRVPGEVPVLLNAFATLASVGARQIDLAAGTYQLIQGIGLDGTTLRGAGIGQTILQLGIGPTPAVVVQNSGSVQDITLVNRNSEPSVVFASGGGSARRVEFTSLPGTADGTLVVAANFSSVLQPITLDACVFNTSSSALDIDNGLVLVTSSVFRDLGAVSANSSGFGYARYANCLFTRCGPTNLFDQVNTVTVFNSIFWDNNGLLNVPNVSDSLVPGVASGTNFTGNPKFVNAAANNFQLGADSPCIDRGSVSAYLSCQPSDFLDFAGRPRAVDIPTVANRFATGGAIDVGPMELAPPACPGDLNADGVVDDLDFQVFVVWYNQVICP
ncbi:MAG: hypothetical protein K2Y21_03035 [Phycisphaerales bacterium]|nr:hypothetical protein [Phycisphaerales bacterium]